MVRHLKNEGLVKVSKAGITLSNFGQKIFSYLKSKISQGIEVPELEKDIFQNIRPIHMLLSTLKPSENDVIIIGSATNKRTAELGAKTAALELLKNNKHKIDLK